MTSRRTKVLAGLALAIPLLLPGAATADDHEPTLYIGSATGGSVAGISFADEDILAHDLVNGGWTKYFDGSDVGLRWNDVNAFHVADDGSLLLTLERPQRIEGRWVDDSDVIAFSPTSLGEHTAGSFEMVLDGSDVGLSKWSEDIDAIAVTPDERLLLSTTGRLRVPRTSGGTLQSTDEDLIVFDAESLGEQTAGTFERYFDGSDVGLRRESEDIWGAWVEPDTGDIAMTTRGNYQVPDLSGDKEDVIVFEPTSLGITTTGSFYPGWDGDDHGLSGQRLDGLSVDLGQQTGDPQFQASLTNDWVSGWNFTPDATVTVTIYDTLGGTALFTGTPPTDPDGNFHLDPGTTGIDLMPGTYIEVDDRTLVMEPLTFDTFDPTNDILAGTANPGTTIGFGIGNETAGFDGTTTADSTGNWNVDLSTQFDLTADMGGQAWISDTDGDQTIAEPPPI
ncbi:MAG: hypothetical protein HKN41_04320 [Ilumatobacter sp.]|nr:hypothetical protein [Ilumatobacter sp.]